MAISPARLRPLAWLWLVALVPSAALVLAGRRWPDPLEVIPWLVWLLLVLPPLAMALWLLANWSIPANGHEGESVHSPQNEQR